MNEPDEPQRQRICVIDHGYHRTTKSNAFFLDLLDDQHDLTVLHDEQWQAGQPVTAAAINAVQPDAVVFFQIRPRRALLARLRCPNLTWVPMRDDIVTRRRRWERMRPFGLKIISFSLDVEHLAAQAGLPCLSLRYYPAAKAARPRDPAPVVLWWYRHADVDWPMVESLLGEQDIGQLLIRHAPDPGQPPLKIPPSAHERWPIREVHGWLEPQRYQALIEPATHVIAPRLIEGIGQPVLEAMARGQCVIAADRPTMNEYIQHGYNGLLYDPETPTPVDLGAGMACGPRAHQSVVAGHSRWKATSGQVIPFVIDNPQRRRFLTYIHRLREEASD